MVQVIYCFNQSTLLKSSDMFLMINALNMLLPAFCKMWSPQQYVCQAAPPNTRIGTSLYCVFLDSSDAVGALAYHTEVGNVPFSKVFVKTILQYGGAILMGSKSSTPTVSQAFSHEIYEMIVNMNINVWWQVNATSLVAAEVADPVEGNIVPVKVGSSTVGLSDYVLPAWSDPQANKGPYNYLNTLSKPFQVAKGGYLVMMKGGVQTYVMGSSLSPYVENKMNSYHRFPECVCEPVPEPLVPIEPIVPQESSL
jgi:hypothetical protein